MLQFRARYVTHAHVHVQCTLCHANGLTDWLHDWFSRKFAGSVPESSACARQLRSGRCCVRRVVCAQVCGSKDRCVLHFAGAIALSDGAD